MVLIATPQRSLEAAAQVACAAGVTPVLLGDTLEGESREVAKVMAGVARSVARHGTPAGARTRHAHAHFECSRCGRVICLADATVPVVAVPNGYRRDEVEVTVKGSCDRCSRTGG